MQPMKVLITAYDVNPFKGSESGMGWNFIVQAARYAKVVAVTRCNNQKDIEEYLRINSINLGNIEFYYFDLPYYLRFWKRGGKGAMLYFYLWQFALVPSLWKRRKEFDLFHGLNFHTDVVPSFLWLLGRPFVWGPINHHEKIPRQYLLENYGISAYFKNRLNWLTKRLAWMIDPFSHICRRSCDVVLAGNLSVPKRLKLTKNKYRVMSSVGSTSMEIFESSNLAPKFRVLSVGRFVPLKGFDIAIKSFSEFCQGLESEFRCEVELIMIGSGPLRETINHLINESGCAEQIRVIEWMSRDELANFYNGSSVFLFPSFEGAGMVVAEAMSAGLPVICFDNYGPGELAFGAESVRLPYAKYDDTIEAFSNAIKMYWAQYLEEGQLMSAKSVSHYKSKYEWCKKGDQLHSIYSQIV